MEIRFDLLRQPIKAISLALELKKPRVFRLSVWNPTFQQGIYHRELRRPLTGGAIAHSRQT